MMKISKNVKIILFTLRCPRTSADIRLESGSE